jgi:hypothetical protein
VLDAYRLFPYSAYGLIVRHQCDDGGNGPPITAPGPSHGAESNIGASLTEPLRRRMIENITVRYVPGEMEPAQQCFADLAELSGAAVARTGQGHRNDIADAAFFLRHPPTSATDVVACVDASLGEIATLTAISTDFLSFLS